jgi:hypothetical protein
VKPTLVQEEADITQAALWCCRMIRRLSDAIREEDVSMPDSNANHINIAKLLESHANANALETLTRTFSGTMSSVQNGSISDLDF